MIDTAKKMSTDNGLFSPIVTDKRNSASLYRLIIMDRKREKIDKGRLDALAARCCGRFREITSKRDALRMIAETASGELGGFLNAGVLADPDDVAIGFIELLDQIIFEMSEENAGKDGRVEEYILDDLYQRIEVYLDLFAGMDVYGKNLHGRMINRDDTVIIRHYRLSEFIPVLTSEFYEQPGLRKPIVHALMFFTHEDLLNLFYEIAKGEYEVDLKIPALAGLKNNRSTFYNWNYLKGQGDQKFDDLITFITAGQNGKEAPGSASSENAYILYFRILQLELLLEGSVEYRHCRMMIEVLNGISRYNMEAVPFKNDIYESLSRILNKMHRESMRKFFADENYLASFMYLIDSLPMEVFDRIILAVEGLGEEFISSVKHLISKGKLQLDEKNSKLSGYLFSLGFDPIML